MQQPMKSETRRRKKNMSDKKPAAVKTPEQIEDERAASAETGPMLALTDELIDAHRPREAVDSADVQRAARPSRGHRRPAV